MDHDLLIEYLDHFLAQQKCYAHKDKRAKVMRIGANLNEAFVCSECMEVNNKQISYISVKHAEEQIKNFILFDQLNHNTKLDESLKQLTQFRQQLTSFFNGFNSLLDNIEVKLRLRSKVCEKYKQNYERRLFDLQKCVNNYNKMKQLKSVDVNRQREEQGFSGTLNHNIFLLLQNEQLVSTCNFEKQQKISEIFTNSTNLVTNLIAEQQAQLQSLIDQEDYLMSLIVDQVEPKHKTPSTYQSTKTQFFNTMVSSYSSQMRNADLWFVKPQHIHKTFLLKDSTSIQVVYDHTLKDVNSNVLRLALISPGIQSGPLKQPRSITFQIDQQIKQILLLGVCDINQKDCELNLAEENRSFIFFSCQGYVLSRSQDPIMSSPSFARGDTITLIIKPQTNYIQMVKNNQHNQPYQMELPNANAWQWTSINFCVGVQGSGGAEIRIVN